MRKTLERLAVLLLCAAAIGTGCAKTVSEGTNVAAKRYLDAWMQVNHPSAKASAHGIFVLEDIPGTGEELFDSSYVFAQYTYRTLDGEIVSYTNDSTAKQMNEYDPTYYYGSEVLELYQGGASQGILDLLLGGNGLAAMKVGGSRTAVIPGWLSSTSYYYDSEKEYQDNVTGTNYILDIKVTDCCDNIIKYQVDKIEDYLANVRKTTTDSTGYGFYYRKTGGKGEPYDTITFPTDTSIYINYIGRLLSGRVFDTNIKDTAKVWGLYDEDNDYEPVVINWGEELDDITMTDDDTSVITGFAKTLWQMHPYEKGYGVFTSYYGYGYSGSGNSIPGYAPLIFEIEIVDEPED